MTKLLGGAFTLMLAAFLSAAPQTSSTAGGQTDQTAPTRTGKNSGKKHKGKRLNQGKEKSTDGQPKSGN